jgi:NAD-dependent deacetylase sirtuin 4
MSNQHLRFNPTKPGTQNVDRFHQKAGTQNIIELHGNSYTVKCMSCKYSVSRFLFQQILTEINSDIISSNNLINEKNAIRSDADVDIDSEFVKLFRYPSCPRFDGLLKPDIIFFGDNVPKDRVNDIYKKLNESDALLVIGSSLHVYSGHRFG